MAAYKAQAQKIFNNAYGAWEQIRNGTLPRVDLEVVTKQWAIDTWGKGYAQQNLQAITIQQNIYQGLFLIPQNRSLYQAEVDWAGNYVAATWEGKIYVVKENFNPWDLPSSEATFVHELTHIWQSNLPSPTTFDEDKAHTALIEGDASFMADTYTNLTKTGAIKADVTAQPQVSQPTSSRSPTFILTRFQTWIISPTRKAASSLTRCIRAAASPRSTEPTPQDTFQAPQRRYLTQKNTLKTSPPNLLRCQRRQAGTGLRCRQVTDKTTTPTANTSSKTSWATGLHRAKPKPFQQAG